MRKKLRPDQIVYLLVLGVAVAANLFILGLASGGGMVGGW